MTDERARWVEVLKAGKVAQLIVNTATGGLCILAGPEVLEDAVRLQFAQRQAHSQTAWRSPQRSTIR